MSVFHREAFRTSGGRAAGLDQGKRNFELKFEHRARGRTPQFLALAGLSSSETIADE
jgi:hypothetical protein